MFKRGAFKHKVWEPVPTDFTETVRRSVPCAVCRGLRAARAKRPFPSRFCRAHLRKGLGGREGDEAEPAGFGRLIGVHDHLATTTNALDQKKRLGNAKSRNLPLIARMTVATSSPSSSSSSSLSSSSSSSSSPSLSCHKKQFRVTKNSSGTVRGRFSRDVCCSSLRA